MVDQALLTALLNSCRIDERVYPLLRAAKIITGARAETYKEPEDSFRTIAAFFTTYIQQRFRGMCVDDIRLEPYDAPLLMDLLKTSRLVADPTHEDSWTDKAGYTGCGYECAVRAIEKSPAGDNATT